MRKRSNYKPRLYLTDPISLMQPASKDQVDKLMLIFYSALQEIATGKAPEPEAWRQLADGISTVDVLANQGKLPGDVVPIMDAATSAMVAAMKGHEAGNGLRFSGAGLQAVRDAVELYRQCLAILPGRDMYQARQAVVKRVRDAMRNPGANCYG